MEPKVTRCKSCGKSIVFAHTTLGKAAPYERDDAHGEWEIDEKGVARHMGAPSPQMDLSGEVGERWTSHFATCKQAREWRRR